MAPRRLLAATLGLLLASAGPAAAQAALFGPLGAVSAERVPVRSEVPATVRDTVLTPALGGPLALAGPPRRIGTMPAEQAEPAASPAPADGDGPDDPEAPVVAQAQTPPTPPQAPVDTPPVVADPDPAPVPPEAPDAGGIVASPAGDVPRVVAPPRASAERQAEGITLTALVLFFGLAVLLIEGWLIRTLRSVWHPTSVVRVMGLTLIVIVVLVLTINPLDQQDQFTAVVGLLGAITGYLLGKDSKDNLPAAREDSSAQHSPPPGGSRPSPRSGGQPVVPEAGGRPGAPA